MLPYTPEQLFDLVADVGRYQEFLPWVAATRIRSNSDDRDGRRPRRRLQGAEGDLHLEGRARTGPTTIDIDYVEGPLKYLHNSWKFRAAPGGSEVDFCVDFAFRSRIFEAIAGPDVRPRAAADDQRVRGARGRALRRRRSGQQQLERAERRLKADAAAAIVVELLGVGHDLARDRRLVGAGEDDGADRLAVRCRRPGPAMPVSATATSAPEAASAPCAIAQAVATETEPNVSSTSSLTPSSLVLASFE